ncbi:hypothetical protein J21TS7_43730 [Paenibacillus cineris]|uniref:Uncharacterized protein n=1 Tax=Paenibacillus cineris TaxID=237530 RepID=A0ABQ4LII1_9BACL|nr:hypothetical protein J21TS7_43730 [Paenibacillus cineris]
MYVFIAVLLAGIPLYWMIRPGKATRTADPVIQPVSSVLPLGGESK